MHKGAAGAAPIISREAELAMQLHQNAPPRKKESTMAEMRNLTAYFSNLCEGGTWEKMEPVFEALFHPDVVILGNQSRFDFEGWKRQVRDFLERGVYFDMEKLVKEGDKIVYTVTIHDGDASFLHTAKGIFKDGKMIRTEPADPSIYDRIASKQRKAVRIL
jgi:hypothetical protein